MSHSKKQKKASRMMMTRRSLRKGFMKSTAASHEMSLEMLLGRDLMGSRKPTVRRMGSRGSS